VSPDLKELHSGVFLGEVFHQRNTPTMHEFTYPLFSLRIRLSELPELSRRGGVLFSNNSFALFSIYDSDYLTGKIDDSNQSIETKVRNLLSKQGVTEDVAYVDLVSHPRLLGYVFNPVSFFLCYRQTDDLVAIIAEVHNTFGEKHLYVLSSGSIEECSENKSPSRPYKIYQTDKQFHVSPFFDRSGSYRFAVKEDEKCLDLRVSLLHDSEMVFTSRLLGNKRLPWNAYSLVRVLFTYPGSILLTMSRIVYQASLLKFRRKLKVFTKPIASHPMTIESRGPGILQKLSHTLLGSFLSKVEYGSIRFLYPNGESETFKGTKPGSDALIHVHNYDVFLRSALSGDIGFGEAYVEKDWDSDDLVSVIRFFSENIKSLDDHSIILSYLGRLSNAVRHLSHRNSIKQSRHNIHAHYDLSNELFSSFLDNEMLYSSGIFESPENSLEKAQENKIDALIQKAQLQKEDHLLEIGCGWGGLAIRAAKTIGCRVTGVTLSEEQKAYADKRILEEGLSDLIEIKLIDYRLIEGSFDKIISVEMIEAVGHAYLEAFFECTARLLKKDGILVLQAITMPEQRYEAYRKGCDWIQKYIFPGGHCPSLEALLTSARKSSDFVLDSTDNIGLHYARTLHVWRNRFNNNWDHIKELGFDERFRRMWNYYLAYCEAGFSSRVIHTHQLVFARDKSKIRTRGLG